MAGVASSRQARKGRGPRADPAPSPVCRGADAARLAGGRPSNEALEALCTHCGKCCYKKIVVGRAVFITPFPCEFLDTATNLCTVYPRRHEANPECLDLAEGMSHSAFPADCSYVPVMAPPGYVPAIDTWRWDGEWSDFDHLADQLSVSDRTREKVRDRGPWAPPMWAEATPRAPEGARADKHRTENTRDAGKPERDPVDRAVGA